MGAGGADPNPSNKVWNTEIKRSENLVQSDRFSQDPNNLEAIMTWQKIDPNNLPKREVLAVNFRSDTYGYGEKILGRLYVSQVTQLGVSCENDIENLDNCTHYFDIEKIKMPSDDSIVERKESPTNRSLHPGAILAETIEKIGISQNKLAELMGVHPKTVEELILGDFPISEEMGDWIGEALGMGDRLWFRLQQEIGIKQTISQVFVVQ